ncbi:hypothetical protein BWI15_13950 [Kribbella sp. ALI-6-A]|uniref:hypothetical protein n=1 Tax=Kribbella sp. ALI-6-A TaxID=1933817 RepID=UPI00097C38A2|nr:hypothetical protein [Kribbella sp. ALI-6-A]ONI74408.1 hypothetical protein BWI15_13950 [Kribbella sp. ALI-6-A]
MSDSDEIFLGSRSPWWPTIERYVLAPLEESAWSVSAEDLAVALRGRWPDVRVGFGSVGGSSMILEALIPGGSGRGELGIALSGTGQAVTLDPADLEGAAEFAVWFAADVAPGDSGLHLIEPGSMRSVELVTGITPREVRERLV